MAIEVSFRYIGFIINKVENNGELAQLARASALQAEGQRFESVILHNKRACQRAEKDEGKHTNAERGEEEREERRRGQFFDNMDIHI